jgi:hypothetical protein
VILVAPRPACHEVTGAVSRLSLKVLATGTCLVLYSGHLKSTPQDSDLGLAFYSGHLKSTSQDLRCERANLVRTVTATQRALCGAVKLAAVLPTKSYPVQVRLRALTGGAFVQPRQGRCAAHRRLPRGRGRAGRGAQLGQRGPRRSLRSAPGPSTSARGASHRRRRGWH